MLLKIVLLSIVLVFLLSATFACTQVIEKNSGITRIQVPILFSLGGDFPVSELDALPEAQRLLPVGCLASQQQVDAVLQHFQEGGKGFPAVDFSTQLVLFARNTVFYNRLSIAGVTLVGDSLEVLSMSTMSAMPIKEKVAMSLAVVERSGARFIVVNGEKIEIRKE